MREELQKASNIIKKGGLVIFPTETVYAIGANGLDKNAVEKIYKAKKRNRFNPINLLVSDIKMIESITKDITDIEYKLIQKFFPGPLTIILNKKECIPDIVTAGNSTVGIRMPANKIALDLIKLTGVPIAAPSANISGKLSGTNIDDIKEDFTGKVNLIIDGGESKIGIESTIVKVIDNVIHVLRPGAITKDELESIAEVSLDYEKERNEELPSSNLLHYRIKTKAIVMYNENNKEMIDCINNELKKYDNPIMLSSNENARFYNTKNIIEIGSKNDLEEISRNIFKNLKKADEMKMDIIIIEGVQEKGIGIAIMDRIRKICV